MDTPANHLPAILWVLLSTFLWTLVYAAAKFADGAIGVFQITLLRYMGAFVILLMLMPHQGGLKAQKSNQPGVHFARALCGCGAAVAITWASANMPLVDATAISMLFGVMTLLLGAVVLKERISPRHWLAVAISVSGVVLVMASKGAFETGVFWLPAFVAFMSALLFAIEGLLISVLGRLERAYTVMLYVTFFGLCLMIPPAVWEWKPVSLNIILLCLLLGPAGLVGQYCTIRGYRSAHLSVVAPVDYSWLIFSALLGLWVFGEVPPLATWIGCLAILVGGIVLVKANHRARR